VVESLIRGYAEALFRVVQAEGELERVEDELFRFGKLLESQHELKQVLSDRSIDRAQRVQVLEDLLSGKVSEHTLGLVSFVVEQGRGRQLPQIIAELSDLVAEAKKSVVAEVRSAVPLDSAQRDDLAEALSKATGKNVELKVLVDTSVIGGIVAKVGDTIIDGSVRRRLEQLKTSVGSG
jgi:F-type H+-transporting ATPase subunit delta